MSQETMSAENVWGAMNFIAAAQSQQGIQAIGLFCSLCLREGADFESKEVAAPGLDQDNVMMMAAYIQAFAHNVLLREGPQHDQWPQFVSFVWVCISALYRKLPPDDGRRSIFERMIGHSPDELYRLHFGGR